MLKYIVLFLMALTCTASEPKFHFMDCVKILNGFYKNCKGNVVSHSNQGAITQLYSIYGVEVDDCKGNSFTSTFDEDQLEGCKK